MQATQSGGLLSQSHARGIVARTGRPRLTLEPCAAGKTPGGQTWRRRILCSRKRSVSRQDIARISVPAMGDDRRRATATTTDTVGKTRCGGRPAATPAGRRTPEARYTAAVKIADWN